MKATLKLHFLVVLALLILPGLARAQSTAFTYNGRLILNGAVVSGPYEMQFTVYDAVADGNIIGGPFALGSVDVVNGLFTARIDLGANVFIGPPRWLDVAVRPGGAGDLTVLTPRQEVTSSPYAIRAQTAGSVAAGTVVANQLNTGGVPPTPGQFLSYNGGNLFWTDPGAAAGNIWTRNGANTYYSAGSVGIGTSTPLARQRLHVVGGTTLETGGSGGGFITFGSPNSETGMTINGTASKRADIRFDGSTLKLVATSVAGPPSVNNGLAITTAGNVGIGTATPVSKLHVLSSQANTAAVYGNATAAGGVGVYAQSAAGPALHAEGNATQAREKGGFVKAMAYIDPFLPAAQYVVRCYNSQTSGNQSSTAPCGITVTRTGPGRYIIDFGFDVRDRFISVTPRNSGGSAAAGTGGAALGANQAFIAFTSTRDEYIDLQFYVFVY